MLARKEGKYISDLLAAIVMLEKDVRHYETSMGAEFPQDFKIPMLTKPLPEADRKELKLKYKMGQRDFRTICGNISAFAIENSVAAKRSRRDGFLDPPGRRAEVRNRKLDRVRGQPREPA